jgi:hypothetical protein
MKRIFSIYSALLALVLLMTACGDASQATPTSPVQEPDAPVQPDEPAEQASEEPPALQPIDLSGPDVGTTRYCYPDQTGQQVCVCNYCIAPVGWREFFILELTRYMKTDLLFSFADS